MLLYDNVLIFTIFSSFFLPYYFNSIFLRLTKFMGPEFIYCRIRPLTAGVIDRRTDRRNKGFLCHLFSKYKTTYGIIKATNFSTHQIHLMQQLLLLFELFLMVKTPLLLSYHRIQKY